MKRIILHSDANSYYASVEMLLDPSLRGKAVAVCGSTEERHGIVLAKSELAKQSGVKTGMANWEARQACPGLIIVPPQYDQYCKFSRLLRNIYLRYTDLVEPYGMDECWLDVTGSKPLHPNSPSIAEEIRQTVKEELGLTVSIGVSFSKVIAKLGSDMKKPDAVTVLMDGWKERVWPLPASELLFVGRQRTRRLNSMGIYTIGALANTDPEVLRAWFGKEGIHLWLYANGLDEARVQPHDYAAPIKSVGHGITCNSDLHTEEEVWRVMLELSQDIGHRLRTEGLAAKGVSIAIRDNCLGYTMCQARLPFPSQSPLEIAHAARQLFSRRYSWQRGSVRAVTVTAIDLIPESFPVQLDVFNDAARRMKLQKLEACVDQIRGRFGKKAITSAALMADLHMPDDGRHSVVMPSRMFF